MAKLRRVLQFCAWAALAAACLLLPLGCAPSPASIAAAEETHAFTETPVLPTPGYSAKFSITPEPTPTPTPPPFVTITQPELLVFIRRTLHESQKRTFSQTELEMITFVELEGRSITDLSELAALPKLDTLVLRRAPKADLRTLAQCEHLNSLTLVETPVKDMESLILLEQLGELILDHCKMDDICALERMNGLKMLTARESAEPDELKYLAVMMPQTRVIGEAKN